MNNRKNKETYYIKFNGRMVYIMDGRRFWGIVSSITLIVLGGYIASKGDYFMTLLLAVFEYSYCMLDDAVISECKIKNNSDD